MNKVYRVVWNAVLGVWQVASELVKSHGKTRSRKAIGLAVGIAGGSLLASAATAAGLPTGGNIVAGDGSIQHGGNNMAIHQGSDKLAIDWQSFSIGKGNTVQFFQPGAHAIALNRVLGSDVSVIQGALKANGQVFLINPNGVLFTPSAQVDVGGLVASTLNMTTEDFLAGNYRFSGDSAGSVINEGDINAAEGGTIALIAAKIVNDGNITAHKGNVLLGAGGVVTLDLGGPVQLEVEEGALEALIENGGAIRADAGRILLTARAAETLAGTVINSTGLIEARSLDVAEDGMVTLLGEQGDVQVAGRIDVSSEAGEGGKVVVTGDQVAIESGAVVDATGATGGGEIYVGGGWQGKDPAIKQATRTTIAEGAVLDASATDNGDGGTVVTWSNVKNADGITRVDGTLKATGGADGGNGGKIETSGARLAVSQAADASAEKGKGGLWLLDPDAVVVEAGSGGLTGGSNGVQATVGFDAIDTALAGGTDVAIKADNSITWNGDYKPTTISGERALTLQAGHDDSGTGNYVFGDIFLNGGIDASEAGSGHNLKMIFDGKVTLGADVALKSNGGDIVFTGVVDSDLVANDRELNLDAGAGSIIFSDMVGGNRALGALFATTAGAGTTYINGGKVITVGKQVYTGAVELGTSQFLNPDFEDGLTGWNTDTSQFFTGVTIVDNVVAPVDPTTPTDSKGNLSPGDSGDMTYKPLDPVVADGAGSDGGKALQLGTESDSNCADAGNGCIMRGPWVVSEGTVSLAAGESVGFDYKPVAGGDTYDVFGYLLNVNTGEYQIILDETGKGQGAVDWKSHTATAAKAGTYKFVFVSGSFDETAGSVVGGSLYVDNIKTNSAGSKSLQGSSITFNGRLNSTDNGLAIKADDINFNGGSDSVTGSGKVTLEAATEGKNVAIGGNTGDATGSLELTGADIDALGDGFSSINIGGADMVGDINVIGDTSVKDDLVLKTGDGDIHLDAGLTVVDVPGGNDDGKPTVIVLDAGDANGDGLGGTVEQTADGAITADGLVLLGDGATHDLDNAANDVDTIASDTGSVSFSDVDDLTVGNVTIPGSQTDGDPDGVPVEGMTQTGDMNLIAEAITVDDAVVSGGDTRLTADEIDLNASLAGKGELALKQKTADVTIELGESNPVEKAGVLQLSKEDLEQLEDGFTSVTIGSDESGDITVVDGGTAEFHDDLNLVTGGKLTLEQGLTLIDTDGDDDGGAAGSGDGLTLSVDAAEGASQSANGAITADGLVLLGGNETDERIYALGDADNAVGEIASNAGKVTFNDTGDLKVGELSFIGVDGSEQTVTGVNNTGDVSIATDGNLAIDEELTTTGNAFLTVGGTTTQDAEGIITADGLALNGGDFELRNAGNTVGDIASDAGKVAFVNSGDLKVGTLTETDGNGDLVKTTTGVNNTGDVSISTDGNLAINEELTTDSNVFLTVGGTTTQDAEGIITADGLALNGGDFELRNAGNTVGDIASDAGKVAFVNSGDLKVGTLTETDGNGVIVKATTGVNNTGDVSIATDGNLAIDEELTTTGNAFLTVGGTTTQDAEGIITADGLALNGGDFELRNAGNTVGDIASDAGKVVFVNSGDLKVGTLTETDGNGAIVKATTGVNNTGDVSIATDGNLAIDEDLTTTGNVFLTVDGKTTQDANKGGITAAGLALVGGDFDLDDASNWVGDIASRANDVSFSNNGDLTVGVLTETALDGTKRDVIVGIDNGGKVKVITRTGDIHLTEQVATSDDSHDAIVLNAGQSASAGTAAGGDVKAVAGVTVSTGAGGRAVIYTGSLAGSSHLMDVVGSGSGNFRYNSDEQQSNFSKALGNSGIHAVYREQPKLVVSTNGVTTTTKVFDGQTSFDGGGTAGYDVDGLWNGDTKEMLGTPHYSVGSAEPGTHTIDIAGLTELGYLIENNPNNAKLSVTPSIDYEAVRQNVAEATRIGSEVTTPHLPDRGMNQPVQENLSDLGREDGGLLLVDRGETSAITVADEGADNASAQGDEADGDSERELAGNVCADGGTSEGGACAAYPPQTVFVVKGGVRLPSVATRH